MIFLLLCRVRIYALFSTKRRYMENRRVHRCILGREIKPCEIRKLFA